MNDKLQGEPTYAFRRLGLEDFCTCTKERFDELSDMPELFEMRIFYDAPPSTTQAVEAAIRKAAEVCQSLKAGGLGGELVRAQDEAFDIAAHEILALIPTEAAQVERDAKDAARYRWLRSPEWECNIEIPSADGGGYLMPGYDDELDNVIDAAIDSAKREG